MALHADLQEGLEGPSTTELVSFMAGLPPSLRDVVHTGFFTEDQIQEAFEYILAEAGAATEDVWPEVEHAIDEFVGELDQRTIEEGFFSDILKSVAKGAVKAGAGAAAHALAKSAKGQKGLKKTLKHAAAGALKQIAKDPSKAKEIAKKSASKLVSKGVKKGMKMVFGRWVDLSKPAAANKSKSQGANTRPSTARQQQDGSGQYAAGNKRGAHPSMSTTAAREAPPEKSKAPEDTKTIVEPTKPKRKKKGKKPEYVQPFARAESLADELERLVREVKS